MGSTEKKIKQDRKSSQRVLQNKEKLIQEGIHPKAFNRPITLQLELTSKCNLFCKHCYNRSGQNQSNDFVTPDRWIDFCEKLVIGGGILQATISGGEPLLLGEKLWNIFDILHDDGTVFNLISNGYLFDEKIIEKVQKYRFYWIQISIDNFKPELHDKFRGIEGSWTKAATAAYKIALSGIPVRIASTITPQDLENLEAFVQMAINLGASYYVIGEVMPSGRAFDNPTIMLSKDERDFFYTEMEHLTKKYKKEISILVSSTQRVQLEYASTGAIDGAIIRPNGNIRLDCSCPFVIGNILQNDIFTVWKEKSNCWQHPLVKKYIESCDQFNGQSTYINNYDQEDIFI